MKFRILVLVVVACFVSATKLRAQVSSTEIETVFSAFHKAYSDELAIKKESIFFNRKIGNFEWLNIDLVLASYVQNLDSKTGALFHEITITGGMLKLDGFDADSAALVLCHELGHGIGGAPFKDPSALDSSDFPSSTEGQSDYYAARVCLPKIWDQLPLTEKVELPVALKKCGSRFEIESKEYHHCLRTFAAMRGFINLRLISKSDTQTISFESFDPTVVKEINLDSRFYPTPQCRLDTLIAGALGQPRPECWYPADF